MSLYFFGPCRRCGSMTGGPDPQVLDCGRDHSRDGLWRLAALAFWIVVLAAAFYVLAAAFYVNAYSGPRTTSPQGWSLEMRNTLEQRDPPGALPQSWSQIHRRVNETVLALHWIGFLLEHSGPLDWPRDQRIYLVLADSSLVRDSLALVSEPQLSLTMRPYPPLGVTALRIEPDDLWRQRCSRGGGVCTVVLVGFPRAQLPRGFSVKDVAGVRVGALGPTIIRAAPREGGAP